MDVVRGEPNEPDLKQFVHAVDSGVELAGPTRVAAWGYTNRVIDARWAGQRDDMLGAAELGLGLLTPWEEQVAALDPELGTKGVAGMMLRFNRTVYEGLIASVNGDGGNSGTDLPGVMLWSQAFHDCWEVYRLTLDRLAPSGTPTD